MLSVAEADALLSAHTPLGPVEAVSTKMAAGRILRAAVSAERPFPPFDRVMMDGIAVAAEAWAGGQRHYALAEEIAAAGAPQQSLANPSGAIQVMTGAVLPKGAGVVVPVERTTRQDSCVVVEADFEPPPGGYIHRAGSDAAAGSIMLQAGHFLDARALGVAVSCGAQVVQVSCLPRLALVSTGDELVDLEAPIEPHQIRRSNGPALAAAAKALGLEEVGEVHLRDDEAELAGGLRQLLEERDFVVLTGGVSMGQFDLVPKILAQLGVDILLHGVAQRPGKPLLVGRRGATMVFGLPGNPVSALVGFRRYVVPALQRWQGAKVLPVTTVALAESVNFHPPLTYFLPVSIDPVSGNAQPRPVSNSGDFAALLASDGFVELPADEATFAFGSRCAYFPW
jgi:molybdopterin molybdotransferase